jgi:hypothetical protein
MIMKNEIAAFARHVRTSNGGWCPILTTRGRGGGGVLSTREGVGATQKVVMGDGDGVKQDPSRRSETKDSKKLKLKCL